MSQKHLLSDASKLLFISFLADDLSGPKRKRSNKNITNRVFKVLKTLPTFIRAKN